MVPMGYHPTHEGADSLHTVRMRRKPEGTRLVDRTRYSHCRATIVERNVTNDFEAAKSLMATSIFATPLLVVGHAQVLGFRPDKLADALSKGQPER
jgi:hypothetical protein